MCDGYNKAPYGFIQYNHAVDSLFPRVCGKWEVKYLQSHRLLRHQNIRTQRIPFLNKSDSPNHHLCPPLETTYFCHDVIIHLYLRFSPGHSYIAPPQLNAVRNELLLCHGSLPVTLVLNEGKAAVPGLVACRRVHRNVLHSLCHLHKHRHTNTWTTAASVECLWILTTSVDKTKLFTTRCELAPHSS